MLMTMEEIDNKSDDKRDCFHIKLLTKVATVRLPSFEEQTQLRTASGFHNWMLILCCTDDHDAEDQKRKDNIAPFEFEDMLLRLLPSWNASNVLLVIN